MSTMKHFTGQEAQGVVARPRADFRAAATHRDPGAHLLFVDVVAVVARPRQIARGRLLFEDRRQERVIVGAEIGRAIVGEHERTRGRVVELFDVRRDLGPTELARRSQEMVTGHDEAGRSLDNDWLLLAEPGEACGDSFDIADSRITWMQLDALDRDGQWAQGRRDRGDGWTRNLPSRRARTFASALSTERR